MPLHFVNSFHFPLPVPYVNRGTKVWSVNTKLLSQKYRRYGEAMGIIEFMPSNPEAVCFHTSAHTECSLKSRWNLLTLNSKEGPGQHEWDLSFSIGQGGWTLACLLVQPNKWPAILFCCLSSKLIWCSHSAQPAFWDLIEPKGSPLAQTPFLAQVFRHTQTDTDRWINAEFEVLQPSSKELSLCKQISYQ